MHIDYNLIILICLRFLFSSVNYILCWAKYFVRVFTMDAIIILSNGVELVTYIIWKIYLYIYTFCIHVAWLWLAASRYNAGDCDVCIVGVALLFVYLPMFLSACVHKSNSFFMFRVNVTILCYALFLLIWEHMKYHSYVPSLAL